MELYRVPNNTRIRTLEENTGPAGQAPVPKGTVLNFKHIDGAYSFCQDDERNIVHLKAWLDVEVVK